MSAKTTIAAVLLVLSSLAVAQTSPAVPSSAEGGVQRVPGPTPDDPLGGKLIAVDPGAASVVEEWNANLDALYNKPTTYYQVVNGYCVAIPMTNRLFFWITRR